MSSINLPSCIKEKALEIGYDSCGIIPVNSIEEYSSHLDERIKSFPESRALYESLYPLAFPQQNVGWAKSIIVCVRRYGKYKIPEELDGYIGKAYLVDGRIKHSKEYSWRLEFGAYLSELGIKYANGIVPASLAAVNAGLGRIGKNNFFYTKEYGSWVFIETWIIDSEMEYDEPTRSLNCPDGCNKCIDSCPTGALNMPLSMNRGKCIAQLTNGLNSQTEGLKAKMGTWVYGCDICQNVYPKNKNKGEKRKTLLIYQILHHIYLSKVYGTWMKKLSLTSFSPGFGI